MIVCPNCNHQNPDGAVQCEACYTPLPAMLECPACGASVQSDASFCGQCGANLTSSSPSSTPAPLASEATSGSELPEADIPANIPDLNLPDVEIPDLTAPDFLVEAEPLVSITPENEQASETDPPLAKPDLSSSATPNFPEISPSVSPNLSPSASGTSSSPVAFKATQIQSQTVRLIHTQTNMALELPQHLNVIHIGKPNDRVPPDIDVSGFPDSEVVSRVHGDIRVEGDSYYLEDVGSSNGTYVNNIPLLPGNRHRLRTGDRIALGKGDKVSFIVQIS